ncbi:uncharacterized protein PpBr36_06180 [Pyricularia pennisetigena]|uniref:uncharacterized protein n=1 Tax=Pyricularia pennisetigena TaxID=1578925 RepID=UPI00114D7A1D|nr:uncharacterized protein PpBr36_06180 [Pyricularia pennisetigena]TLS22785.1 hypothetical protein PpBr36_06180 [Pyricularia pennisetigena]
MTNPSDPQPSPAPSPPPSLPPSPPTHPRVVRPGLLQAYLSMLPIIHDCLERKYTHDADNETLTLRYAAEELLLGNDAKAYGVLRAHECPFPLPEDGFPGRLDATLFSEHGLPKDVARIVDSRNRNEMGELRAFETAVMYNGYAVRPTMTPEARLLLDMRVASHALVVALLKARLLLELRCLAELSSALHHRGLPPEVVEMIALQMRHWEGHEVGSLVFSHAGQPCGATAEGRKKLRHVVANVHTYIQEQEEGIRDLTRLPAAEPIAQSYFLITSVDAMGSTASVGRWFGVLREDIIWRDCCPAVHMAWHMNPDARNYSGQTSSSSAEWSIKTSAVECDSDESCAKKPKEWFMLVEESVLEAAQGLEGNSAEGSKANLETTQL